MQQPFAWAICANVKDIENRSWQTKYRGTIVIVASGKTSQIKAFQKDAKPLKLSADHLTISAAIGIADILDIHTLNPSLESNPWAFGPYCWQLANGRLFKEPIPCKGKLNLYAPDDDLAAKIRKQMSTATALDLDKNGQSWADVMKDVAPEMRVAAYIENYATLEDWDSVLRVSEYGLALDADNFECLAAQADALTNLQRHDEALRVLDRLVGMEPDNPSIYHLRSVNFACLKQPADFQREQDKVVELDATFYDDFDLEEPEEEQQ